MADISAPWWASGAFAIAGGLTQPLIAAVSAALDRNRRKRIARTKIQTVRYAIDMMISYAHDPLEFGRRNGEMVSRYERLTPQINEVLGDDSFADFYPIVVWILNDTVSVLADLRSAQEFAASELDAGRIYDAKANLEPLLRRLDETVMAIDAQLKMHRTSRFRPYA